MSTPVNKVAVAGLPQSDLERFKGKPAGSLEQEKARLKKATKEFESLVVYEMLKSMRKTIPESSLTKENGFTSGMGKDIFEQMFDQQLSRQVASSSRQSIAEMLYKQVERTLDAQYATPPENGELSPLDKPKNTPIPIETRNFIERPAQSIPLPKAEEAKSKSVPPRSVRPLDPIQRNYGKIIDQAAEANQLDSALIASVIKVESNGNPQAISRAGAKGLMQLIDSTATQLGVENPHDPKENVEAGAKYLKQMIDRFGDLKLGLAAYNAGPGNVEKYSGIPPFAETVSYVEKVMTEYGRLSDRITSSSPKGVWDKSDTINDSPKNETIGYGKQTD